MKQNIAFLLKTTCVYVILSFSFSIIGIFIPGSQPVNNPLNSISIEHITGHIAWGLAAGIFSLSLRYFVLGGTFAIMLDADHLIQFLGIEAIPRMGHSIPFALISVVSMLIIFGKRDKILAVVAFSGVLTHISFDIFTNTGVFPLFTPFYNETMLFRGADWVFFEMAAIMAIGLITMQTKWKDMKKLEKLESQN